MSDFQSNFNNNQVEDIKNVPSIISENGNAQNIVIQSVIYPNFEDNTNQNDFQVQVPQQNINIYPGEAINQPLNENLVPILEYDYDLKAQRRVLLQDINRLILYQQVFQVLLFIVCGQFEPFHELFRILFFDDGYEFNVRFILLTYSTLTFLLVVRYKRANSNKLIYIIYFVLYSCFINRVFLGFDQYFKAIFLKISFANLLQLITFQFSLKMKESRFELSTFLVNSCYSVGFIILILLIYDGHFEHSYFICVLASLWPFIFTLFYIPSLMDVYNGKFDLRSNQQHISSVLVQINMFLLCISE